MSSLSFVLETAMLPLNCLFLPLQYTERTIWHLPESDIFSYIKNPNILAHAYAVAIAFPYKNTAFRRNTHSSFKYSPVATDYLSFLCFITIKYHHTKHASDISQTFMTKSHDTALSPLHQVLPLWLNVQP